jgi:hypothetical protein
MSRPTAKVFPNRSDFIVPDRPTSGRKELHLSSDSRTAIARVTNQWKRNESPLSEHDHGSSFRFGRDIEAAVRFPLCIQPGSSGPGSQGPTVLLLSSPLPPDAVLVNGSF